jgi:hypothetical protein
LGWQHEVGAGWILKMVLLGDKYSIHPKAGSSGFQMVISRTLFGSGFQMVGHLVLAAILLKPFENQTKSPVFEWSAIFLPFENRTEVF